MKKKKKRRDIVPVQEMIQCKYCSGEGLIDEGTGFPKYCTDCAGSGWVEGKIKVEVINIEPPEYKDNGKIKVKVINLKV